jgi:hypothetical protein
MPNVTPPDLAGWLVWCDNCQEDRPVRRMQEREAGTDDDYYDYVCTECASILLTVTAPNTANAAASHS